MLSNILKKFLFQFSLLRIIYLYTSGSKQIFYLGTLKTESFNGSKMLLSDSMMHESRIKRLHNVLYNKGQGLQRLIPNVAVSTCINVTTIFMALTIFLATKKIYRNAVPVDCVVLFLVILAAIFLVQVCPDMPQSYLSVQRNLSYHDRQERGCGIRYDWEN